MTQFIAAEDRGSNLTGAPCGSPETPGWRRLQWAVAWLEQAGGGRRALELIGKVVGGRSEWQGARGHSSAPEQRVGEGSGKSGASSASAEPFGSAVCGVPGAGGAGRGRQGRARGVRDRNRCGNCVREGGGTF